MAGTEKDMKELHLEETDAFSGGVLDDSRKRYLLSLIRLQKAFGQTREEYLAWCKSRATEEEYTFIEENW